MAWNAGRSVPLVSASLWANFLSVFWDSSNSSATCCLNEEVDCVERTRAGASTVFLRREEDFWVEAEAVRVRFRAALSWGCRGIALRMVMGRIMPDGALV